MSRLTNDQREALVGGARIRQTWELGVPTDSTHATYYYEYFDQGAHQRSTLHDTRRVVRAGKRVFQVWNPSPSVLVKPKAVRYVFTVDNADGAFHEGSSNTLFDFASGTYTPVAQECRIRHRVWINTTGDTFTEVDHLQFVGQILAIKHENLVDVQGDASPTVAHITTEQVGAWDTLRRVWTVEDADDEVVQYDSGGPTDVEWTVS